MLLVAAAALVAALALGPAMRLLALLPLPAPGRRAVLRLAHGRAPAAIRLLLVATVVWAVDGMPAVHDQSRVQSCASNLRQIAAASALYAADHDGRPPVGLAGVAERVKVPRLLGCPAATLGDCYVPPDAPNLYGYVYRPRALGDPQAILCHDAHPHRIRHRLFVFLDRRVRNVVHGDGTVGTLSEREFEALGLPPAPRAGVPAASRHARQGFAEPMLRAEPTITGRRHRPDQRGGALPGG